MVGKPNISESTVRKSGSAGPPSVSYSSPLDQERAASMADEGGSAAAQIDKLEQEGRFPNRRSHEPSRVKHMLSGIRERVVDTLKRFFKRAGYQWSRSSD
jgi:hypothetical protein